MELPKLPKAKSGLKEGYSKNVLRNYAIRTAMKALESNSVDWQSLTKEEILAFIPNGEEDIEKFVRFAKRIENELMEVNSWSL